MLCFIFNKKNQDSQHGFYICVNPSTTGTYCKSYSEIRRATNERLYKEKVLYNVPMHTNKRPEEYGTPANEWCRQSTVK
jgi:hypothetical protein